MSHNSRIWKPRRNRNFFFSQYIHSHVCMLHLNTHTCRSPSCILQANPWLAKVGSQKCMPTADSLLLYTTERSLRNLSNRNKQEDHIDAKIWKPNPALQTFLYIKDTNCYETLWDIMFFLAQSRLTEIFSTSHQHLLFTKPFLPLYKHSQCRRNILS